MAELLELTAFSTTADFEHLQHPSASTNEHHCKPIVPSITMVKRRQEDASIAESERPHPENGTGKHAAPADQNEDEEMTSGSDGDDKEIVNVDFEFFDPQDHDFHGIKLLLRQLFDADAALLDLSALTDLILAQKLVGSTVKVDGREGDPYSFLTVINLNLHRGNAAVQALVSYLLDRSTGTPLEPHLRTLLADSNPSNNTAIVLSERLINMPAEISPPSYKMLLEEVDLAVEDNEPYAFTNYLLISKVYAEIESKLTPPDGPSRPSKRHKSKKLSSSKSSSSQTFNFHPEDEIFLSRATGDSGAHAVYRYKTEVPEEAADSKRAFQDFGILPKGRMILLSRDAFLSAVEGMQP
ncbi:Mss4p nuclear export [Orbilia brochopaga]|uniref:Mss4p nuclear export n=1 Tax=Orbilia brochopaga TaxID=3140254 RepID=A0AAV9UZN6_9PEZI